MRKGGERDMKRERRADGVRKGRRNEERRIGGWIEEKMVLGKEEKREEKRR